MNALRLSLCAGVAALALSPAIAAAQTGASKAADSASSGPTQLVEVVVTAEKRSENLQRVPIAVSAFGAKALTAFGATSTKDLQTLVPGVVFTQNQNSGNVYIRGVGTNNGTIGQESPVAVYVDGVYLAQAGSYVMDFNNVQQVEVLKGPQGTLFGRNATGGVVQINTKDPGSTPTADVDVGYGNWNTFSGHFYGSTPISEHLSTSLAIMTNDEEQGYGYNVSLHKRIFQQEEQGVQSKWLWRPTDNDAVTLNVVGIHNYGWVGSTTGVFPGSLAENHVTRFISDWTVADGANSDENNSQGLESVKWAHDFGWARFTDIVGLHQYQERINLVQNGIPQGTGQMTLVHFNDSAQTYTEEAQLAAPAGQDFQWIVGLFYMHDYTIVHRLAFKDSTEVNGSTDFYQNTESYSGFAQATKTILPDTRLTLGARYTEDDKQATGDTLFANNTVSSTMAGFAAAHGWKPSEKWTAPTYRVALDHNFTQDILAYISYNTGFKSGIYNPSNPNNAPANPETVKAIEGGLKTEWLDHTLRLNISAFHDDYTNIQLRATVPPSVTPLTTNAGSGRMQGVDIDSQWLAMNGLTFNANVELLDATYTVFPGGVCSFEVVGGGTSSTICNLAGHQMIRSPKFTGNIGAQYTVSMGDKGNLKLNVNNEYNSGFTWDPDSRLKQKPFNMLSMSGTWTPAKGPYYVTIWGKNLLNVDEYATGTAASTDQYAPGVPLTMGVTIGAHF
jgi:iron complex outermembrane receptor protein